MRRITLDEFHQHCRDQGVSSREHFAFRCPACGTIQSGTDWMGATGEPFDAIAGRPGFSCIGRATGAGPHKKGTPPGRGCDWTLGGLFRIHEIEIVTPDGEAHPHFDLASSAEAQRHEATRAVAQGAL